MSANANTNNKKEVRTEKVRVPLKLSAVNQLTEIKLDDDSKALPGVVVLTIANGDIHHSIVFHKPVGETPLKLDDWVATPLPEMKTLLANAKDPARRKKDQLTADARQEFFLLKGFLVKDPKGVIHYPPTIAGGASVASVLEAAKASLKINTDAAREKYLQDCAARNSTPKKDWKYGVSADHFIPKEVKDYLAEKTKVFKAECKATLDNIEGKPYETLAGPNSDRPQLKIPTRGKLYGSDNLVDALKRTVLGSAGGLGPFDPTRRDVVAALREAKDDPAKLKEFIYEFCFPTLRPIGAG